MAINEEDGSEINHGGATAIEHERSDLTPSMLTRGRPMAVEVELPATTSHEPDKADNAAVPSTSLQL